MPIKRGRRIEPSATAQLSSQTTSRILAGDPLYARQFMQSDTSCCCATVATASEDARVRTQNDFVAADAVILRYGLRHQASGLECTAPARTENGLQ